MGLPLGDQLGGLYGSIATLAALHERTQTGKGSHIDLALFDSLVSAFISALRDALPGARDEDIYWCYHNLSGALTLTLAQTGRIDKLSGGKCRSADFQAAYDHMIPFVAAGFREVCGRSTAR